MATLNRSGVLDLVDVDLDTPPRVLKERSESVGFVTVAVDIPSRMPQFGRRFLSLNLIAAILRPGNSWRNSVDRASIGFGVVASIRRHGSSWRETIGRNTIAMTLPRRGATDESTKVCASDWNTISMILP